jgi:hypothetical protein
MRRLLVITAMVVVILSLMVPALAKGPANAGGANREYFYRWEPDMYIGPDYGLGSSETNCSDGSWVDVIPNATLHDKGHYRQLPKEIRISYKLWLSSPVEMIIDGETIIATNHIFFKVRYDLDQNPIETTVVVQSYK